MLNSYHIIVSPNCIRASLHHFNNEISGNQCLQLTITVNLHHEKSQVNSLQNRITMQCISVLLCHICSVQRTLSCIDSGLIDCTISMLQGGYSFHPIVLVAHSQSDGVWHLDPRPMSDSISWSGKIIFYSFVVLLECCLSWRNVLHS